MLCRSKISALLFSNCSSILFCLRTFSCFFSLYLCFILSIAFGIAGVCSETYKPSSAIVLKAGAGARLGRSCEMSFECDCWFRWETVATSLSAREVGECFRARSGRDVRRAPWRAAKAGRPVPAACELWCRMGLKGPGLEPCFCTTPAWMDILESFLKWIVLLISSRAL